MKKFSGDPIQWGEFWADFELNVDGNKKLKPKAKLSYLKTLLEGTAASVVGGLLSTDANYETAKALLTERFGKKNVVINAHLRALENLTPVKKLTDLIGLRKLYDACELHVRSLETCNRQIALRERTADANSHRNKESSTEEKPKSKVPAKTHDTTKERFPRFQQTLYSIVPSLTTQETENVPSTRTLFQMSGKETSSSPLPLQRCVRKMQQTTPYSLCDDEEDDDAIIKSNLVLLANVESETKCKTVQCFFDGEAPALSSQRRWRENSMPK
uniref:Uncharacterized protein n=1 Tax=Strigamia maritima TaxID=126957 RepID=T1IKR2_STRMM